MTVKTQLKNFAVNLFLYRQKYKMSKYQLAKITGLSIPTLSSIENGFRSPSLKTALTICKKLDVPIKEMLETKQAAQIDQEIYG